MIDLGTLDGLHAHGHELRAYCLRCDRWCTLPLEDWVRRGLGARRLPFGVRCRRCGTRGVLQVRPPMPQRAATGWIEPARP